jgi:hypothetical protein
MEFPLTYHPPSLQLGNHSVGILEFRISYQAVSLCLYALEQSNERKTVLPVI